MSLMNLYVGKSGQAAVMAEFLIRGYNVATPEVDRGDDLFVVQDDNGEWFRIQVKAANAKEIARGGYSALFNVPVAQLRTQRQPDIAYVIAVRYRERWSDFIVLPREDLYELYDTENLGSLSDNKVMFSLSFIENDVTCSNQTFQRFRNNWKRWPTLHHARTEIGEERGVGGSMNSPMSSKDQAEVEPG